MDSEDFRPSRRALLGAFAGLCAVAAAPTYARVPGFLRGAGDIRRIRMYSHRTGESIDTWEKQSFVNRRVMPLSPASGMRTLDPPPRMRTEVPD